MSATVTYKGQTLTTVQNTTATLETAGTWLEDDITITDSSGSGTITVIDVPDAHGGIEKRITAVDISDTTAQAADVAQGKVFYTASGTRTTGTASGGGGSVLPDGYTQMLFIQSNANQYIDTGLYTKASQVYYLQYMRGADAAVSMNIFGNNVNGCQSFVQDEQSRTTVYYQFGTTTYQNFSQVSIGIRTMKLDINGCYAWNDSTLEWETVGTITGSTVTENSGIHNILFGRTTGTNLRQLSSVRFFRFKVEDNGVAVRDMYPAMRNLDGVLGMYDTVNDVFYTNAGTGTFTGGIAA